MTSRAIQAMPLEPANEGDFRTRIERGLWRIWRGDAPVLSLLLLPFSLLFRLVVALRGALYAVGLFRTHRPPVPVVSIGNLVVGGTGKTPVTLEVARRLQKAGRRVAILSRGHGRRSKRELVIVSDGEAVRATPEEGGDEPVWLAHRLPGVRVVVAAKRAVAADQALELGADVLVLDDGFSHRALARDVDVLVVDESFGLGNGRLLPAGPLREPPAASSRAALVWLTRCELPDARPPPELSSLPVVRSAYEPDQLLDVSLRPVGIAEDLRDVRVLALCGIARPESFEATLRSLGANVRGFEAFPDHHDFTTEELERVARHADSQRCVWVVTTEKDAARLPAEGPLAGRIRVLGMRVRMLGSQEPLDRLLGRF